jgi:hypothetical protein
MIGLFFFLFSMILVYNTTVLNLFETKCMIGKDELMIRVEDPRIYTPSPEI